MPDQSETHRSVDFRRVVGFACFVGILLLLFWAKDFLLPVVLAALIGFLLIPVVSRLERWGLHPILAVRGVVISALILIGGLCAILSFETLNLVNSLPRYRENITAKWSAIQNRPSGPLNTAFRNIGDLAKDLSKMSAGSESGTPMKVQIVSGADSALALARQSMAPVFGPLSEFAVIAVLVVFIRLVG
jgi:predicted PurR-regulated permease PerM